VRAVLKDLVENGLVFKSRRMDHTAYRAASAAETDAMSKHSNEQRLPIHLLVCRTAAELQPLDAADESA
jgi:hypothetical protein